jgi:hypothetical protein
MLPVHDHKNLTPHKLGSGYLYIKENSMKSTIIAAVMLFSLAGPLSVLAEAPAVTVKPFVAKEVLIDVEATAPVTSMIEEQTTTVTPQEEAAADAGASGTVTPRPPCPMQGMGKMRKGMGHGGHGPGCRKPGCDRHGGGQVDRHEQVVRRLDMIEARIAKIEAMLESLMQR